MTPLLWAAAALAALGFALAVAIDERRNAAPALPPAGGPCPASAVLVPMRNEERNVVPCVEALLAQTARPRIRILDDGSTDRTLPLARERFGAEPRVEILEVGPLAPGWRGKLHALDRGWRGLDAPWVLTTDADVRSAPELLERALRAAADGGLDALSIAGRQEARGWGENLLTPAVFAWLDVLLGDWRAAAEGRGTVANGQFLLLRRAAWDAAGGFATVRSAPIDDVAIAARLHAAGFRIGFFRSPLLRVRMYQGAAETWSGWRRNLGALFGAQPAKLLRLILALALPPALLLAALCLRQAPAAILLWAGGAATSALLRRGSDHAAAYGLLYPLDALALSALAASCALDFRRGRLASWKGRPMDLDGTS
ncbi:MAG TPA: glycosyltransferase family 2 protein [Thermoanaerobaculia bacterium]|nr:glycosyltransferase family 2 protein [Thermoanaerobaculia bacterium]